MPGKTNDETSVPEGYNNIALFHTQDNGVVLILVTMLWFKLPRFISKIFTPCDSFLLCLRKSRLISTVIKNQQKMLTVNQFSPILIKAPCINSRTTCIL